MLYEVPMTYNPNKHHRRSIRLKGYDYTSAGAYFITICTYQRQCLFGEVINGQVQLSQFGKLVYAHWSNLPKHHPRLRLDTFVVMPNHLHGILILVERDRFDAETHVGAGLIDHGSDLSKTELMKPAPTTRNLLQDLTDHESDLSKTELMKPAPTQRDLSESDHGIPEIIRGFKTFSSRRINQIRQTSGTPVWQRNYYEHIIRNEIALQRIQQYVQNNPLSWQQDQLHPANPSKW